MNKQDRDGLLSGLSPTSRKIYEALSEGPLTSPGLRAPTGRADGMSKELEQMCSLGLIRRIGKERRAVGISPVIYAVTSLAEIEQTAQTYETRKSKGRKRRVPKSRMAELAKMETGDYADWYQTRKKIIQLAALLTGGYTKALFWEVAGDPYDMERFLTELLDLQEATDDLVVAVKQRMADEDTRRKIDKLSATNGRTDAEAELFAKKAASMKEKLPGRAV